MSLNLEQTFTTENLLQPLLEDIFTLGNNGIDLAIEQTLDGLLAELANTQLEVEGELTEVNLWAELAEPIASIQSLPQQYDATINSNINEIFELSISTPAISLTQKLNDFSIKISEFPENELVISDAVKDALLPIVADVQTSLSSMEDSTTLLSNEALNVLNKIALLMLQVSKQSNRLTNALDAIGEDGLLNDAVNITQSVCQTGDLATLDSNDIKLLAPALRQVLNIDRALGEVEDITEIAALLSVLFVGESELQRQTSQTFEQLALQASRLQNQWEQSSSEFRGVICGEQPSAYLSVALAQLDLIRNQNNLFIASIEAMSQTIQTQTANLLVVVDQLNAFISGLNSLMASVNQTLSASNLNLYTTVGELKYDLALSQNELGIEISAYENGIPLAINAPYGPFGVNNLDLLTGVIMPIQAKILSHQSILRQSLHAGVSFPGAYYSADEFKDRFVKNIMNSVAIEGIHINTNQYLQTYINELIDFQLVISDQINLGLKAQLATILSPFNELLADATAELPIPVTAAGIDGAAVIVDSDLNAMNIQANWGTKPQGEDMSGNGFAASFTAKRYQAENYAEEGIAGCRGGSGIDAFDAKIGVSGPVDLNGSDAYANLVLGFTLDEGNNGISKYFPIALNGEVTVEGAMSVTPFTLQDFGFSAGIGLGEVYLGAGGDASFSAIGLGLYAFLGRTCDASIVANNDPIAKELLAGQFNKDEVFTGLYSRGSTTIPVFDGGCLLNLSAKASIGSWFTVEPTPKVGGVIGGGVLGQVACIGSVRGQLNTAAATNIKGDLFYTGEAFAVAGAGFDCDRGTWTSRYRSRGDDWCGTADVGVGVRYEEGEWSYDPGKPSAIH